MDIKKINFRQPKDMLPAILYFPILFLAYFTIDLFSGSTTEEKANQKDDYLSAELPEATTDSILSDKMSSMSDQYGNVSDLSAVDNIENDQDSLNKKEEYNSRYNSSEADLVRQQESQRKEAEELARMQDRVGQRRRGRSSSTSYVPSVSDSDVARMEKRRRKRAKEEIDNSIYGSPSYTVPNSSNEGDGEKLSSGLFSGTGGNYPLQYDNYGNPISPSNSNTHNNRGSGNYGFEELPDNNAERVVKKTKQSSDYFNTISRRNAPSNLIRAIVDENVKAIDGTRIRLRLLDDIEVGTTTIKKGTYLYAAMSGFSQQRVKGNIQSIFANDNIFSVSLSIYDTDGLEGLYVPRSAFRETSKEMMESVTQGGNNIIDNTGSSSGIKGWGNQVVQNASQKAMNAIGKIVRKNVVHIKYGTLVYLIDASQIQQSSKIKRK